MTEPTIEESQITIRNNNYDDYDPTNSFSLIIEVKTEKEAEALKQKILDALSERATVNTYIRNVEAENKRLEQNQRTQTDIDNAEKLAEFEKMYADLDSRPIETLGHYYELYLILHKILGKTTSIKIRKILNEGTK